MSNLTKLRILKRQKEKLKERNRELKASEAFWHQRAKLLGELNAAQQKKIRRLEEVLDGFRAREEERRAARPRYSCAKKESRPPLAPKYQSALVVSGD
jgi:hypothetical protein